MLFFFFFSSRRRHTRYIGDWSSDVCSSDLAARRWINWFEPSGDVFRLLLRGLYEDSVHPFLLVHTVPEGKRTGLCLTHDVDAREAFRNALTFAQMEAGLGVRSTFFVTTKYFTDSPAIGSSAPQRRH